MQEWIIKAAVIAAGFSIGYLVTDALLAQEIDIAITGKTHCATESGCHPEPFKVRVKSIDSGFFDTSWLVTDGYWSITKAATWRASITHTPLGCPAAGEMLP